MQVDFYHLTVPLARVLPPIAQKVIAGGGRLLIVSASDEQRAALDRSLWDYASDSFLPHAQAGRGDDSVQPILIASDTTATNAARYVAIVDGLWRDDALGFDRVFHLFDDDHIHAARLTWKALADAADVERRYWKQNDDGRWEQAA